MQEPERAAAVPPGDAPEGARARPREALLALAVSVLAAVAPAVAALATGHTIAWRDTARLLGPYRPAIEEALRALRLPLWAPHEALGAPLFAQLFHGVLHPVSVLLAFVAPGAPIDAHVIAHVGLGAAGAWALARVLRASPWAAAVAAIAYGLSGYLLSIGCNLTYLAGGSTAPWAIAGLARAGAGRRGGIAAAGAGIAALVFSGEPQWLVVASGIGLALAWRAGGAAGIGRALLGAAIGALVAGVQLVPALAYFRMTSRAHALSDAERALWALPPLRLVELVLPGLFNGTPGAEVPEVFRALGGGTGRHGVSFVPSVFVGAAALALAAVGARERAGRVLAVAAGVLVWLALGVHAGAAQLLAGVPVWGAFRYSEKLVGPLTLCLAALAGLGADRVWRGDASTRRLGAGALALAAVLGVVVLVPGTILGSGLPEGAARLLAHRLRTGAAHAAAGAAGIALALDLARRGKRRASVVAVLAIVALEAAAAAPYALHLGTPGVVDPSPLRALRRDAAVVRVATPVLSPPILGHDDLDAPDRVAAFQSRIAAPPYGVPAGIDQLDAYSGFSSSRFDRVSEALERDLGPRFWGAWRRLGLTHVVVPQAMTAAQIQSAALAIEGGVKVLQDETWRYSVWRVAGRDWASFAPAVVPVTREEDAYPTFAALVAAGASAVALEGPAPRGTSEGRVLAVERSGGHVRIDAEAAGDALLVVGDSFWPGWEAEVDGHPAVVQRADAMVRAVPFPAGRHVLEMAYRPGELSWGIAATLLGLVLLGLALARGRARPDRVAG